VETSYLVDNALQWGVVMGYKILVTNGYNIVTSLQTCRDFIKAYKEAGIYRGMLFLPFYNSEEVSE
jgi:ATP adenylyltransferase/5',5'''-P-1,P-4-tetraphosphate phosphorylase II